MPEKIAILCSDLHLSHSPPLARSGEPDWYEAMARPLRELSDLADELPVLCGGDVFDRWNSPPSLINFAMEELPAWFLSVAGQHDIPYHSWEEMEKSAFQTLLKADCLNGLSRMFVGLRMRLPNNEERDRVLEVGVRGFQWGEDIQSVGVSEIEGMSICIAHRYVWYNGSGIVPLATDQNHANVIRRKFLNGYDVALFGDNHAGFLCESEGVRIFNAGTFMRRTASERSYPPMVGILFEDGTIEQHRLDTSREAFDSSEIVSEAERVELHLDSFLEELRGLEGGGLDFGRALEVAMEREGVSRAVRRVILEAKEKGEKR